MAAPLHLRVFLSSPGDVAEERRIARQVIEGVPNQPAFRGKVTLEVIAWDDPDAPTPMNATETPQASVNRYAGLPSECDLTIVVLWGRLGTPLPAESQRKDGTRYESGTVWELEDASQANKDVWIYRRAEEPLIGLRDPEYERKRAAFEAVETFFERFTNADGSLAGGINAYATAADFATMLGQQLEGFVRHRLEAVRQTDAPAQSRQPPAGASTPSWNWPRAWDFSGYLAEKRRAFVGRHWLFDEVRAWSVERNAPQALLLCADFGVGKSAFMAELAAGARGVAVAAHHFCHHDTVESLNPATFVRSIAAQLAVALPQYKCAVELDPQARRWLDEAQADPASAFERAVVAPLNAIADPGAPRVLLVDALDEALDFERSSAQGARADTIVRVLAARAMRLPAWLKILATSRRRQEVLQPMQQAFRCRMLDGEDVRNLDDIRLYVENRCASNALSGKLAAAGTSASAVAALLASTKQSGGKFLYVVRVLNDIESGTLPLAQLDALPPGMDGFYLDAFERRFPRPSDYAPVRPLLAVLCAQREPISRADLAAILCVREDEVRGMLAQIEDFLNVRARRYAFDHLSVAQWLSDENEDGFARAGRFAVDEHAAHASIADWARRALAANRAHESPYLARHLGAYLDAGERRAAFSALLLDLRWLDARLRAAGIDALLGDFTEVEPSVPLAALGRALGHAAHVLGREGDDWQGDDFLASQLLGRLQDRAEPEIRALCAQAAEHLRKTEAVRPLTASLRSGDALLRTLEDHSDGVWALAVLTDGRLASGSCDGAIKVWNSVSGVCEATLNGYSDWVYALAVLADGRLAAGSWNGMIEVWDPMRRVCNATLEGHSGTIYALAVLADGRLVSGSQDGTIRMWDPARRVCNATLEDHSGLAVALAVLPDRRLAIVFGGWNDTIEVWNPTNRAWEATLEGDHCGWVDALAVLADGRLACGSKDGTIKVWDPVSRAWGATLKGHSKPVNALAVLADGRLASASDDGTIRLWDPASGVCEATLEGHSDRVNALAVFADGRLASASQDRTIKVWDPTNHAWEATPEGHSDWVTSLAVLADGRLASASDDGTIRLWDPASGVCEATLEGHSKSVGTLALLADGRLASGSLDGTIKVWDPASGACEATLEGHRGWVGALAVLASGRLASAGQDKTVRIWHRRAGRWTGTVEFIADAPVSALVFVPHAAVLVVGDAAGRVHFLKIEGLRAG